ncbi:alpha/beta-hydrolase [Bimuria novae-zelandiae CBS 107.79]|uniref:Alpha/beta-hydrolase n=1 Tax=Bimuria novae-zelandiae CBS 107.79 TaxID=1447943 RepID=A0A6A5VHT1_9PLEO|nr:alpha/beta-hydrolase [Bimuria novae-zelandiae CBS 107.79]
MSSPPISTGEIPFNVPAAGKPFHTWYKTVGDVHSSTPLILCHDLATKHSLPLVLYDQLGCGKSTHLKEKAGDEAFWTIELFLYELDSLIDCLGLRSRFYLYGQSWGDMVAAVYAACQPMGLKKMENACMAFYTRFICRLGPWPKEMVEGMRNLKEDPTVYNTMQGTSEFGCTGSLKEWEGVKDAHKINVETLLSNGRYDEMTDEVVKPWFEKIERLKWVTLKKSAHMGHWEGREVPSGSLAATPRSRGRALC